MHVLLMLSKTRQETTWWLYVEVTCGSEKKQVWNYWLNQWKFLFKTSLQPSSISHPPLLDARQEILM